MLEHAVHLITQPLRLRLELGLPERIVAFKLRAAPRHRGSSELGLESRLRLGLTTLRDPPARASREA